MHVEVNAIRFCRETSRPASTYLGRHTARDIEMPILNASYFVPAQPVFRKVDRVARFR